MWVVVFAMNTTSFAETRRASYYGEGGVSEAGGSASKTGRHTTGD